MVFPSPQRGVKEDLPACGGKRERDRKKCYLEIQLVRK
jgi:hypothetical protein